MSYREPAPRQPRLWLVVISYSTPDDDSTDSTHTAWVWALEANVAVARMIAFCETNENRVWASYAYCGEDFADVERAGPTDEIINNDD